MTLPFTGPTIKLFCQLGGRLSSSIISLSFWENPLGDFGKYAREKLRGLLIGLTYPYVGRGHSGKTGQAPEVWVTNNTFSTALL